MDVVTLGQARVQADRRYSRPRNNKVALIGSSYVGDNVSALTNGTANARSVFHVANIQMGHRYNLGYLDGIAGSACTDVGWAARIATAAASDCSFAVLAECLTNAVASGQTLAAIQAALTATFTTLRNAGKTVVIGTCPPRNTFSFASYTVWSQINTWLRQLTIPGIIVVDQAAYVSDAANVQAGFWFGGSTLTPDGVHPIPKGAQAMAKPWVAAMTGLVPPNNVLPLQSDLSNLMPTTAAQWTGGTSAAPTSWALTGGAGATWSQVARPDGRPGIVQQVVIPPGVYNTVLTRAVTAGFAPGDRIVGSLEVIGVSGIEPTPAAASQFFYIQLKNYTPAFATAALVAENMPAGGAFADQNAPPFAGVLQTPTLVVPASGTQEIDFQIFIAGGATFQFGCVGMVKVGSTY